MSTFETILLMLLVVDALALAALVLLQHGRGADIGAAFGSGSSNTVFGSAGSASFLTKLTVWLAVGFFLISFGLAYTAKQRASSLQDLGIPSVPVSERVAPEPGTESDVPREELTEESDRVDSDLPDV